MPDQTPATELLTAAKKLRAFAAEANHRAPGPWLVHEAYGFLRVDNDRDKTREAWTMKTGADLAEENRPTAEYIALMHPTVGLALADWLEQAAKAHDANAQAAASVWDISNPAEAAEAAGFVAKGPAGSREALAVARALLGEVTQ